MRHRTVAMIGSLSACALLSGCFGSGSPEPTADHGHHHRHPSSAPTTPASSSPAGPTSQSPATTGPTTQPSSVLHFSPPSNGKHSHTCIQVSESDPVDYVYYPVMVKAASTVTLGKVVVTYADGVQDKGAWVAPSPPDAGTGFIQGWPAPSILTRSNTVQWSKRVSATGATLTPGGYYNVFLHLTVYPDALPLKTSGVVFTYRDSSGSASTAWGDHVTYQAGKC